MQRTASRRGLRWRPLLLDLVPILSFPEKRRIAFLFLSAAATTADRLVSFSARTLIAQWPNNETWNWKCVCVCVSGNKLRIARFSCSSACLEGLESDSLNWRRICWPRKKDNIGNEQVNSFPYKFLRNRPMITRFHSVKPGKIHGNLRKALPKRMETK